MNGTTVRGWFVRVALGAAAACVGLAPAGAATWTVSTVSQLNTAMSSYASGDEIVIMPGTYNLTTGWYFTRSNVTIRGATGNRDDVVLFGGGMNNTSAIREIFNFPADDVRIKDLTISGAYHHAIHLQPGADRMRIQNVRTLNIGCQHIKGAKYNYDGIIERSLLEQTEVRQNGLPGRPDNYVGGIDLHGGVNFQIRDNVVMRTHGAGDAGDGGIFLWNDSRNPTIERNVVVGCSKGIELGNFSGSGQGAYNVSGGIVRNNFVIREYNNDIGMEFWYTRDIKVYNNTVYSVDPDDPDAFRTVSIGGNATYPTVNFVLADNIIRGDLKLFSYSDHTELNNIITRSVPADWFADPANFNLHLTELAALAIGQGVSLAEVLEDFDRDLRPYGNFPDIGADEWRLAGDADLDLDVDFSDYQAVELNFGITTGATWSQGDFDFDGDVDFSDYQALESNFGRVLNAASVPEPCMLVLLGAGAAAAAVKTAPRRVRTHVMAKGDKP